MSKFGGGKNKKKGKKMTTNESRELILKGDGLEYGQNIRLFGEGRFEILCSDGKTRHGSIKGSMRKRVFVNMNDIVLVSIIEYEPEKCIVIHKYNDDEIRQLKKMNEIPDTFKVPEENKDEIGTTGQIYDDDDDFITFEKVEKNVKKKKDSYGIDDDLDELAEEENEEDENEDNKNEDKKDNDNQEEEQEEEEEEEEEEEQQYNKKVYTKGGKPQKYAPGKQNKTQRQNQYDKKNAIDDL